MASFECRFNSWCRGRPARLLVRIPDADWGEMGFTEEMRKSGAALAPDDCEGTLSFVPLSKRIQPFDHRPPAKYPVLYLLCGADDDADAWLQRTQVELFCEERKIALVLVDPEQGEWHLEQELRFLNEEVHQFVCAMFPISERAEDRYLAGINRGAGGAIHQMIAYPGAYGAVGLFSSSITFYEDDPVGLTRRFFAEGKSQPPVFMAIGAEDRSRYRFHWYKELLAENGAAVEYEEIPGYGHGYRAANEALEDFLNWLPRTDFYAQHLSVNPERADGRARKYRRPEAE